VTRAASQKFLECTPNPGFDQFTMSEFRSPLKRCLPRALTLTLTVALFGAIAPAQLAATPLEDRFPSLKDTLPRFPILKEATPLHPLPGLARELNMSLPESLLIKRDDISESLLGGNKARKLEYLLGEARARGAKSLITSGMWGSNHALATAIAGHEFGFRVHLHLGPQPVTDNVRQKLLAFHALGANLHHHSSTLGLGFAILKSMIKDALSGGTIQNIPPGGSNTVGSLGYINGYLEFAEQIRLQHKALPQRIIVPVGTMGTAAGLLVGSCLAGHFEKIRIVGVGVSDPLLSNESSTRTAARKLHDSLLERLTPQERLQVPECDYRGSTRAYLHSGEQFAPGYGTPSPAATAAIELLKRTDGISLEGTYSGKAMAWLIHDIQTRAPGEPAPSTVFWLTYNSHSLGELIAQHPWTHPDKPWLDLPEDFHALFE